MNDYRNVSLENMVRELINTAQIDPTRTKNTLINIMRRTARLERMVSQLLLVAHGHQTVLSQINGRRIHPKVKRYDAKIIPFKKPELKDEKPL